ncbi:hypothetical protein ABZ372_34370, partial [Streptomyces sp. NPDC005921]
MVLSRHRPVRSSSPITNVFTPVMTIPVAGCEDTPWAVAGRGHLFIQSARVRRESYVGPWLPEPVDTSPD